jgi:hypothetical protein
MLCKSTKLVLARTFILTEAVSKQIIALPFYLPLQGHNLGNKINDTLPLL